MLDELDTTEMAAVLRWSVASVDAERVQGDRCETELWPLARFVAQYGQREGFEDASDFKAVVARPGKFGGGDLVGMEVRYNGGENRTTGDHWGGVREVANVRPGPIRPTCCLKPGCRGADYRCLVGAPGELPLACEPSDDTPRAP